MAFDLGALTSLVSGLTPSTDAIVQNVVTGAAASVVLAGLKSQAGQDAVDPLHLIHPAGGSAVVGKSITVAAFSSLDAATKAQVLASGYVIAG